MEWVDMRIKHGVKSNKTIQEDLSMLKNVFKNEPIADMQIEEIKKKDIKYMYERWTGPGLITRKAFVNRKSALNGVFTYAAENEYIPINFIPSIGTSELKFKEPNHRNKAFHVNEREKLLNHLRTLEPDGYILAIQLALYSTFRVGELRALRFEDLDRTFATSQNPHGKEPCGLTFLFGPISDPLSRNKGCSYLQNIIEFYSSDFLNHFI